MGYSMYDITQGKLEKLPVVTQQRDVTDTKTIQINPKSFFGFPQSCPKLTIFVVSEQACISK